MSLGPDGVALSTLAPGWISNLNTIECFRRPAQAVERQGAAASVLESSGSNSEPNVLCAEGPHLRVRFAPVLCCAKGVYLLLCLLLVLLFA